MKSITVTVIAIMMMMIMTMTMQVQACTLSAGGVNFDLTTISGQDFPYKDTAKNFDYNMAFCNVATKKCGTTWLPSTSVMCQFSGSTGVKLIDTWTPGATSLIDAANPGKGVQVKFTNGDASGCSTNRATTVQLTCDSSAGSLVSVTETSTCNYMAVFKTSAACPPGFTPGGGPVSGLSGGSIFLIVFFVSSFLYFSVGCVYKRQKLGVTDWKESIPNYDFWSELPSLCKDGCVYTWTKLRGLCNKGDANYSSI